VEERPTAKKRPVALVCPSCGGGEYTGSKPVGWVAFASDRKCAECGTRYSPPTPAWAALVFILFGLAMAAGGLVMVGLLLGAEAPKPIGLAVFSCIAVVGGVAVWHGVRALLRPGKI
jgi:hypothetical protein